MRRRLTVTATPAPATPRLEFGRPLSAWRLQCTRSSSRPTRRPETVRPLAHRRRARERARRDARQRRFAARPLGRCCSPRLRGRLHARCSRSSTSRAWPACAGRCATRRASSASSTSLAVLPTYLALLFPGLHADRRAGAAPAAHLPILKLGAYVAEYRALGLCARRGARRKITVFLVLLRDDGRARDGHADVRSSKGRVTASRASRSRSTGRITTLTTVGFGDIAPRPTSMPLDRPRSRCCIGWGILAVPTGHRQRRVHRASACAASRRRAPATPA